MFKKAILFLVAGIIMFACKGPSEYRDEKPGEIFMVYTDWSESIALTHLAMVLLERDLNYDVILKLTDVGNAFNDIAAGEADVFADAWLPATHSEYVQLYANELEDLGPNYEKARTGLVVPNYFAAESIAQLNDLYDGAIVGIDSAAGIMFHTRRAIDAYDLKHDLLVSSESEMTEKLEDAFRRRESIVITGWEPHWLFHRYELRYLDDPERIFMEEEKIHTIARRGFSEEHPRAAKFFERMKLTEKQINSLLFEMRLEPDPLVGVRNWIYKNSFIVNQWTKDLGVEREKIM